MKKALFVLLITTIALTGFRKNDDTVISFNSSSTKEIDLSQKNTNGVSLSANTDTTKKGGGRNEIPNRTTGNGVTQKTDAGKQVTPKSGAEKTAGGKNMYTPYRSTGSGGKEGHGHAGSGKKETEGNGGAGKEGAGGRGRNVTSDPGTGGTGKEGHGANGKKEAVIFRQQKSN